MRPHKLLACLENIRAMIGIDEYVVSLNLDLDDYSVNNSEIKRQLQSFDNVIIYWSLSKNKIHAINRSTPTNFDWKWMILTADDFWFVKKDFGKQVIQDFKDYFPDGDGLIHYPDGRVNERLVTMPVMGRKYYHRTNYIYNPAYVSVKGDKEQHQVAELLGRYKYIPVQIADHRHPRWTKEQKDDQLKQQDSPANYAIDGMTFNNRKLKNFDL